MSTLYVVATPIGNLSDIASRALEVLTKVDLILCEDTRVTQKLLCRFNIETKTLSYHQHSKLKKINYILKLLEQGKDLALVSDAGTPGISDPCNKLIRAICQQCLTPDVKHSIEIIPIPGPSALTAAVSISGFPMGRFLFLGFPPTKKRRNKFFEEVINSKYPVILYESPHRILKTLNELSMINNRLSAIVCRELTKKFEITYRGTIESIIGQLEDARINNKIKGEFVIVVSSAK